MSRPATPPIAPRIGRAKDSAATMTVRERYAMAAMQGAMANPNQNFNDRGLLALFAVKQADALIKELDNGG